jgi:thiamine kinase-like enzyme
MDTSPDDIQSLSRNLLSCVESPDTLVIRPLIGGGNNKVFVLETDGVPKYLMKHYFQHAADPRDRCRAEWTFLVYAANAGISCIPKPISCDPDRGVAIYQYIKGHKILAHNLNENHIAQSLDFFEVINKKRSPETITKILPAAEACFSLRNHLNCVNWRISRLLEMKTESAIDRDAVHFVRYGLFPLWERIQKEILEQKKQFFLGIDKTLSEKDICISPSDFGFHNAIQTDEGQVFFIDFEYAGRDDPVKMICDFFCQPEVSVPDSYLPEFSARVLDRLDNAEAHYKRMEILLPVHKIKWCCIILNEFLPVGRARRVFANCELNIDELKGKQLKKARKMFDTVNKMF